MRVPPANKWRAAECDYEFSPSREGDDGAFHLGRRVHSGSKADIDELSHNARAELRIEEFVMSYKRASLTASPPFFLAAALETCIRRRARIFGESGLRVGPPAKPQPQVRAT